MLTQSRGSNSSCGINVQGRVVAQRGKNSSSTSREMWRGGLLEGRVELMEGAAPASEWQCERCDNRHSTAGRFCTRCAVRINRGACTLPRPRPRIPEAQNSAHASASSGVASADQPAARSADEQGARPGLRAAPLGRTRPRQRPSRSATRRRSRSRSRTDSMLPEPPISPEEPEFGAGPVDAQASSRLPVWSPWERRYLSSAREARPSVGTHGAADLWNRAGIGRSSMDTHRTAAREPVIDLTDEGPARLGSVFEPLGPRMALLGRHCAANRREPEPEPEPEPLTLRCNGMRLIAGSIRRDPYESLSEADPPA